MMNDLQTTITFTEGGIHAEEMMTKFRALMLKVNPRLVAHFDAIGLDFVMFSFRWMLCFLSREVRRLCVSLTKSSCPSKISLSCGTTTFLKALLASPHFIFMFVLPSCKNLRHCCWRKELIWGIACTSSNTHHLCCGNRPTWTHW